MPETAPPRQPRRTTLFRLLAAVGLAIVGVYGMHFAMIWEGKPNGPAVPGFILFFVCGTLALQRRRSLAFRTLPLFIAATLAVPVWWFTPVGLTHGMSLGEATAFRDELKTELSSTPTFESASQAITWKIKRDKLDSDYHWMANEIDSEMRRCADRFFPMVVERYRDTPTEDTAHASQIQALSERVFIPLGCRMCADIAARDWIRRAVAVKKSELEKLSREDWVGFDQTAPGRYALFDAFYDSHSQLISTEGEWILDTVTAILPNIHSMMNPKLMREKCCETEKQLLALNSLDTSSERFREARTLLFRTALHSAQSEIQSLLEAGRVDVAYGIARKLAVDWFATAEILGPEQLKRLEDLRDRCRDQVELADQSGEGQEVAPTPRILETAPAPRLKT